jgi:hypothetical protein
LKNKTWALIKLSKRKKAIKSKWVSIIKQNTKFNQMDKYNAQLVAKGFAQTNGINFSRTYTLIVKFTLIITLLAFRMICN